MRDKTQNLMRGDCGPPENPPWVPDAMDPREERDRWRAIWERRIRSYHDKGDHMTLYDCGTEGFCVAWTQRILTLQVCLRWIDADAVVRFPR